MSCGAAGIGPEADWQLDEMDSSKAEIWFLVAQQVRAVLPCGVKDSATFWRECCDQHRCNQFYAN